MKNSRWIAAIVLVALVTPVCLLAALRQAQGGTMKALPTPPPVPPPKPVTDTYFGTKVVDPYRYFENMSDPVVTRFFKQQNAYTRRVLAMLGAPSKKLFDRIKVLDNAGAIVNGVTRVGDSYFYEKLAPGDNSPKLYVRAVAGGPERLLVDPQRFAAPGKHDTINYFLPSLDGKHVAYGISEGGSEASVIHVVDVDTGTILPDAISRAYYVGATSWLPDGKSFYYVRFPKLKPGEPETDKETRAVCYLHVLGNDPDKDVAVFGYDVNPALKFALTDFPIVVYSPVSDYTIGLVAHGVKNEVTIYAVKAPVASADSAWQRVVSDDDDVTAYDVKGDTIYLLTHKNAPTFKVVATSLAKPDFAGASTLLAPGKEIVSQIGVAKDGLYVRSRDGGFGRVRKFPLAADGAAGTPTTVTLPYQGSILSMIADPREDGTVVGLTGWTHSLLYYAVSASGAVSDTHLKTRASVDMSAYTSKEVEARGADGTMVPLSIIYRKGIALDGSHPTYLEGYGAYGITLEPSFSTTRVAWLERGGVYAICHPRGGGWYGEAWHKAGMIATKPHTWQDFIACGEWLVRHKYTSPQHLAGEGTSAGGITIGRAITTRPDLFAAALDVVGVSNALRSEFTPNGPPNVPEFGTVKNQVGFKALYAMDAYQHVVNGTRYPAVMLITGYNDPRVSSWELAKFAARLQQASSSGRPILLRVDYDAGHGFLAASRTQSEQLLTDEYAFLLWQLGDPAFSAVPKTYAKH